MFSSFAFKLFLGLSLTVSACVLLFWVKRHPDKRFRPRKGEVVLMSLFFAFASGGLSFMMAKLLDPNFDPKRSIERMEMATKRSRGKSTDDNEGVPGVGPVAPKAEAPEANPADPPFLQEGGPPTN